MIPPAAYLSVSADFFDFWSGSGKFVTHRLSNRDRLLALLQPIGDVFDERLQGRRRERGFRRHCISQGYLLSLMSETVFVRAEGYLEVR